MSLSLKGLESLLHNSPAAARLSGLGSIALRVNADSLQGVYVPVIELTLGKKAELLHYLGVRAEAPKQLEYCRVI